MPCGGSLVLSLQELAVMQEIPAECCAEPAVSVPFLPSACVCTWMDTLTDLDHMEASMQIL